MDHSPNRKRRTREHIIADLSVNHVERFILQCGWTVQRYSPDYGIDLITAGGCAPPGRCRSLGLARCGILPQRAAAGLLVIYDAQQDRAWWLHLQQGLREAARKKRSRHFGTLTVHVPLSNTLDTAAVRQFARFRDAVMAEG